MPSAAPWDRLAALVLLAGCGAACGSTAADVRSEEPRLRQTFDSPEALARAVLRALEEEDVESLESFPLAKDEFLFFVWPKLPSARPERNVPFEYAWGDLHQKSTNAVARTYARYRGERFELLDVRFEDGVTDYGPFRVHRDARVKVRNEEGEELWLDVFGSVLERQGRFKLFSYVVD